jgi:hypothetical protein
MQNEMLNIQMDEMVPSLSITFETIENSCRMAAAFTQLAEKPAFALLLRYEARLSGDYQRAFKQFLELRDRVALLPPNAAIPNEPTDERTAARSGL